MKRLVLLLAIVTAGTASATPHIPRSQIGPDVDIGAARLERLAPPRAPTREQALAQLGRVLDFEKKMQFTTACQDAGTGECEFGGIIEVETGEGFMIVQSDNTQEAVWDWSFGKRMGVAANYQPQTDLAFMYLNRLPGWLECMDGGGTCPDYYSFYNCGWGMRAVIEYENITSDMSHHSYGEMCAAHARMAIGFRIVDLVDAATEAWTASGLWLWGDYTSNQQMKTDAATIGGQVKAWLDAAPDRVHLTNWAASGGAAFYGVLNSYMKEHPSELSAWVGTMAPQLGGWIDETQPTVNSWRDWRNAHNAWNMLGHFAAYHAAGDHDGDPHLAMALSIYDMLVAQDSEPDGGIQGSAARPNDEDQSWITTYLTYFGIREVLALPAQVPDGGATGGSGGSGSGGAGGSSGTGAGDSGCSCNVGAHTAPSGLLLLAFVAALVVRRRR